MYLQLSLGIRLPTAWRDWKWWHRRKGGDEVICSSSSSEALKLKLLSHVWLCDPMDCSPAGSSIHGISQERILEWIAISFYRGSSWPSDQTQVLLHCRQITYLPSHQGSAWYLHSSVKLRLLLLVDRLSFTKWKINYELVFFSISVALVKMKYLRM